jgi:hypothetical protein
MAEAEPFDLLLPLWMVVLLGTFADCLQNHPAIETGSNLGFVSPFSAESPGA